MLLHTRKKPFFYDIINPKKKLSPVNEYIFGAADFTGLIDKKFDEYRYGLCIGKKLDDQIMDGVTEGPTVEYSNYYNKINQKPDIASCPIDKSRCKKCSICVNKCPA